MKKIIGIDLGTNSIGWAIIICEENGTYRIEQAGSRIIPMDAAMLGDFDKGNSTSQTSERTKFRSTRRLRERHLLRRERLHRTLNILGYLPEHYAQQIDFSHNPGKFIKGEEPKLAWTKDKCGNNTFLFQTSFQEMLTDFAQHLPDYFTNNRKIPYDWTLYYLRKKALTEKISKEELAWILLNFNQKRGYYQLRSEEEETKKNKQIEYHALRVVNVEATEDKKGKGTWYNIHLENGWIYRRSSDVSLKSWEGMTKDFIVTTDLNDDGTPKTDKQGNIKRSFRAPNEDDWMLLKAKTENDINASHKTIGEYIYDTLLEKPQQKIRGKLVRTIERKFYKDELRRILEVQTTFHPELQDHTLLAQCIQELYPHNEGHRNLITRRDFIHLFIDDILFYQRPLKSKKSLIGNCPYESHKGIDKETGEIKEYGVKCIAKSHPLYQEFRLWQFLSHLRIYQKEKYVNGKLETDVDVTNEFIASEKEITTLFEWLNERTDIDQKSFLKYPPFGLKKNALNEYRWNYVEDKTYPCNETRALMLKGLKDAGVDEAFLDKTNEYRLWHILYSVDDKQEIKKAMATFVCKYNKDEENKRKDKNNKAITLDDRFVEAFSALPPFKKEYGSYSEKAIRRLLPLMRMGKYWNMEAIDAATRVRINNIIDGVYDETIMTRVREKAVNLTDVSHFRGLPLWLACYVVYNRHSEAKDVSRWNSPDDIDRYLIENECCKKAYIKGAFLGSGSCTLPGPGARSGYHLEVVFSSDTAASSFCGLLEHYEILAKSVARKGTHVVYLKSRESISDFLDLLGAASSLARLDRLASIKDLRNNINRVANCRQKNFDKSVLASVRQVRAIERIRSEGGLKTLAPALRTVAEARLADKEASLKELSARLGISKSSLNDRLRKLEKIAEEYSGE